MEPLTLAGVNIITHLAPDKRYRISVAVFRCRRIGGYAVLLLQKADQGPSHDWWNLPSGPALETDVAMTAAVGRIVFEKSGLGLRSYHKLQEVESTVAGSGPETITNLNFLVIDTSSDEVVIGDKFSRYDWVEEKRYHSLNIPDAMKEVVRQGFTFYRSTL
ncbi:Dehydrogenase E1 component [Penicillium coprophilum]|uniref:Dehydrogenase E1 component n=1 Tax=Penicillium coprophilum TaxID=36646 RepID=UPI0023A333D3|nr:Dehydrogenase E1 component [Penicillium coprophilum]KAJ5164369.1 Dehydrogenase E1 component [Penicillium coprophilum]